MKLQLFSLLLAAAAMCAAADDPALTGQWKLHTSISGYENDFECAIKQEGKDLSGTCKSEQGTLTITGKVEEKKFKFQYKTQYNGEELTIVHTGKREGQKISGEVMVEPMGVGGEFSGTLVE